MRKTTNPHEACSTAVRTSYIQTLRGLPRAPTTSRKTNKIDHRHLRHFGRSETAQKIKNAFPIKRSPHSEKAARRRQSVQNKKATRWWRSVYNKSSNTSMLELTHPPDSTNEPFSALATSKIEAEHPQPISSPSPSIRSRATHQRRTPGRVSTDRTRSSRFQISISGAGCGNDQKLRDGRQTSIQAQKKVNLALGRYS